MHPFFNACKSSDELSQIYFDFASRISHHVKEVLPAEL